MISQTFSNFGQIRFALKLQFLSDKMASVCPGLWNSWAACCFCSKAFIYLNSVLSQCARGKSSIAWKPEVHPKIFKW